MEKDERRLRIRRVAQRGVDGVDSFHIPEFELSHPKFREDLRAPLVATVRGVRVLESRNCNRSGLPDPLQMGIASVIRERLDGVAAEHHFQGKIDERRLARVLVDGKDLVPRARVDGHEQTARRGKDFFQAFIGDRDG